MAKVLTRVALYFGRDRFNDYLRFGRPEHREDLDRRRAYEYFKPDYLFGYVRWRANDYGTAYWRFAVLRAGNCGTVIHRVPGIRPGAEILADARGTTAVRRLFCVVDAIEDQGIDPADVAPWYYILVHARLKGSFDIPVYRPDQHRAWLLERRVRA